MNCTMYEELLAPYMENELDSDTRRDVEAHVAQCPHCQRFLSRLQVLDSFVDECTGDSKRTSQKQTQSLDKRLQSIQSRLQRGSATDTTDEILTPQQVAEYLKIPVETVHEMSWELPFFRMGKHLRMRKNRLIEWIEEQEHRTGREALTTAAGQL